MLSLLNAQPKSDPAKREGRVPERVAALNRAQIFVR
jgi:hypothetical protein